MKFRVGQKIRRTAFVGESIRGFLYVGGIYVIFDIHSAGGLRLVGCPDPMYTFNPDCFELVEETNEERDLRLSRDLDARQKQREKDYKEYVALERDEALDRLLPPCLPYGVLKRHGRILHEHTRSHLLGTSKPGRYKTYVARTLRGNYRIGQINLDTGREVSFVVHGGGLKQMIASLLKCLFSDI